MDRSLSFALAAMCFAAPLVTFAQDDVEPVAPIATEAPIVEPAPTEGPSVDAPKASEPAPQGGSETSIVDEDGTEVVVELEGFEQKSPPPISTIQFIDFDEAVHVETTRELDKESRGKYTSTRKKLEACKELPVDVVWQHFSPFYVYKWSPEFVRFSALFLAIWERESRFHPPKKAVHVSPNCRNRKATLVQGLPAHSVRADLFLGNAKIKKLERHYPGCSITRADFGPLQWNYHWRLSRKQFRKPIEKALMLSSQYPPSRIRGLEMPELARLIQFNPHALFVLAGLSFQSQAKKPWKVIRGYNVDKKYQKAVFARYQEFRKILEQRKTCAPELEPKKRRRAKKG